MTAREKIHRGRADSEPVGADGLGFSHRRGKRQFAIVIELVKLRVPGQQAFDVQRMIDHRRENGFGWLVLVDQFLDRGFFCGKQYSFFLEIAVLKNRAFQTRIAKIETEGCLHGWLVFRGSIAVSEFVFMPGGMYPAFHSLSLSASTLKNRS